MKQLLIATHNQGKVDEFRQMFADMDLEIKSATDFDLPEPEETEKTFEGNALLKARAACDATGLPALADDSGICVDALGGAPGIYSARWGQTPNGRDFNIAMERVNKEVGGIDGTQTAYFIAVLALVYPDNRQELFEGKMHGTLTWPMRGAQGHGYDPIFVPEGYDVTCAQMTAEDKNKISHRAIAVEKFKKYLQTNV